MTATAERRRAADILTAPLTLRVALTVGAFLLSAISVAFAAGIAKARMQSDLKLEAVGSRLDAKLDAARFTADSARRDSDHEILLRVDRRVQAMYCDGKPAGCQ